MINLNSNLVYGYHGGIFNPQEKRSHGSLSCSYGASTSTPFNFSNECTRTAEIIAAQAKEFGLIPTILLSGGLDSEVVVKAFLYAGVEFKAITFRYPNGLNKHEIRYVEEFKARHTFEHEYYDIDILKFCKTNEARELFQCSYCTFFEMVPHMHLCRIVYERGGLPILGNGEALLLRDEGEWKYIEYEYDLAWYRFGHAFNVPGVYGFFQHTPNITLAMLNEPRYVELAEGKNSAANVLLKNSRDIKYKVYFDHWPDLIRRQKYDGGELLRHVFKPLDVSLRNYDLSYDERFVVPVERIRSELTRNL